MFGQRLAELRKKKDMSQVRFASVLQVSPKTVAAWEVGRNEPNLDTLSRIATYFGVSIDYLLGKPSLPAGFITTGQIPVLGRIAAGVPIPQQQDILEILPVPLEYCDGNHFALIVNGDSMEPTISNGSLVIVQQCFDYTEKKPCVYLVNGEVTIKRGKKNNGTFVLSSDNSSYEPMILESAAVYMQGIVVKSIRDVE